MSVLDSPFHFDPLPTEELSLPDLPHLSDSGVGEFSSLNDANEHRVTNLCDSSIRIPDDIQADDRLKHLLIRDCSRTNIESGRPFESAQIICVEDSNIHFCAVRGSLSLTACRNVTIEGYCSQLRLTDCTAVNIRVQTASSTALVNSSDVRVFRPVEVLPESQLYEQLRKLNMHTQDYMKSEKWRTVVDFGSLGDKPRSFSIHE